MCSPNRKERGIGGAGDINPSKAKATTRDDPHHRSSSSALRLAVVLLAALSFIVVIAVVEGAGARFIMSSSVFQSLFGNGRAGGRRNAGAAFVAANDDDGDNDQLGKQHALSRLDIDYTAAGVGSGLRGTVPRNDVSSEMRPVVIAGPSGVGKGTLINMVLEHYSDPNEEKEETSKGGEFFAFSVSHTTRGPRPGEVDGVHYHFSTKEAVRRDIDAGKYLEHAEVHGNLYGTSFDAVDSVAKAGKVCILDIDMQGVQSVKKSSQIDPFYIFIAPPSMELLEKRLRDRGTETEEALKVRTANAAKEVEYGKAPGNFDAVVVNDDKDEALRNLLGLLQRWYPHLPRQ